MQIIYEPKGKAKEYAPLALNHYSTCEHSCKACYCPRTLHKTPDKFFLPGIPVQNLFERLEKDCKMLLSKKNDSEILLSFIGDPYQPAEVDLQLTRQVIRKLIAHNLRFTILTKGGTRAVRDFDLLEKYDKCSFGTTLIFTKQSLADEWESRAPAISDRVKAIQIARERGIRTWLSLEPVIDADQGIQVLAYLYKYIDHFKIGKINYWPELEKKWDWVDFREHAKELLDAVGASYYFKRSLTEL